MPITYSNMNNIFGKGEKVSKSTSQSRMTELSGGYTMAQLNSLKCRLIFRDQHGQVLAVMPGCQTKISAVYPYRNHKLSSHEKTVLQDFIKKQKFSIAPDAAKVLGLSIIRYADQSEEYLNETELKSRLHLPLEAEALYICGFKTHTLEFRSYTRCAQCNIGRAQIKKLLIGHNCDMQIDARDNKFLQSVKIGNNYNGSLNLSRSDVENIFIGSNCRCDLSVFDSRKCFSLDIENVYSGNLYIRNSCVHNLQIGYYSYANLKLEDNWGQRNIWIGDSFRGNLEIDSLNAQGLYIGKDCKGLIKISGKGKQSASRGIIIGDEFFGTLDLQGGSNINELRVGARAGGKFYLWGQGGIKTAVFGAYFGGVADFSESSVEYIEIGHSSGGEIILRNCQKLQELKVNQYHNLQMQLGNEPQRVLYDDSAAYYIFAADKGTYNQCRPLSQKIYQQLKNAFSGYWRN